MKRGRKRIYGDKMTVTIGIRVPADLADAMFVIAHRQSTDVSSMTRPFWERIIRRQKALSENCPQAAPEALLRT